jgi:hypothetical protein
MLSSILQTFLLATLVSAIVFGGLGNQLFEYACAYSLAKKNDLALHVHIPINTHIDNSNLLRKDWLGSVDKRNYYNPEDRSFALQYFRNIPLRPSALLDNYLSSHHQVVQLSDRRDILSGKYPAS